ncbi:hypothetical protein QQF64_008940 [Cirrhinus molitorella]|uniref:B-cell receptor CD22 n=1 Tax=Cirrhinus molitorella TaxID=172907 RepID=A0ABR3M7K0_9TELE
MMVHEGIPLLLFVLLTGSCTSSEELINVPEKTETAKEGSTVTIPCTYKILNGEIVHTLLWFKDSEFNTTLQKFFGTIVYSNTKERPQLPDYSSRVEYITDATSFTSQEELWIKCDLKITDLQKTDSGKYSFRLISSHKKYMSKPMTLAVQDNPCKVRTDPSKPKNPLNESEEFTVRCSTFGSCDLYPEWLVHTSTGQKQEWMSTFSADMIKLTEETEEDRKVTKLNLNVTWMDNNGILSCRPGKSEDSWQIRNITLSVEHAPKETKVTVSSENVKEGDSVTLSCTSRGRPDVSFTWFKNEKIEESQKMSDLKLINVKPEDSGEYYCEAKNEYGAEESNKTKIDVKYGPQGVKVQRLDNINDLKERDKLTLKCSVQKANPAVYQFMWYKNYQTQRETSETFIINNVSAEDRGSYHCEADNGIKTAKSDEVSVTVKYSPRIKIEGATSVNVGTTLTLTCSADADPQPHMYTWKHTPGLPSFSFPMNNKELKINKVTTQHAGQYTCDVTNTIGTGSRTIEVDVLYPPSNFKLTMKREVREFEVISIICTVQSFPQSVITVTGPQGNLTSIQRNQRKQRNSTASANALSVYLNVTESDAGMYTCKAKNQQGENETKQELTVLHAPKNVTASVTGEQTFGRELTLTCAARANPAQLSYEWKKRFNGQLKAVRQSHEQRLHFLSLEISDSGQYVCIAKNNIGKTESPSVEIKVKYAPNINIVHNMTTLTQGNWEIPVSLTCSADAYPPATVYNWYREEDNMTVLSDHQNFTVQPQNPGMYYCTANNAIGKSRSKNIMLFISSNSLKVFYQIIFPIILLLILIVVAFILMRRTIIKGSRNNTQGNLSVEDIADPSYGRVNQSRPTTHSQDADLNPRPNSNIHTVYAAIKLPKMKEAKKSPKQQKTGYMDTDTPTSTLNYVTLDFKGQNKPEKRVPESSAVYAVVSKNKQTTITQSDHDDYENVSSAHVPKVPFINMDWESDTSEEDEVNYSTVSCSAKPAVKDTKPIQKSHLSSSSSDDEDRTTYSDIKT